MLIGPIYAIGVKIWDSVCRKSRSTSQLAGANKYHEIAHLHEAQITEVTLDRLHREEDAWTNVEKGDEGTHSVLSKHLGL